jgi:hypothetical protein
MNKKTSKPGLTSKQAKFVEESVLQFQKDLLVTQQRLNHMWNVMNVAIRVLQNNGLLKEEDMQEAGAQLYAEWKKNEEVVKEAVRAGTPVNKSALSLTPVEGVTISANKGV